MSKSNLKMSDEKPLLGAVLCCTALTQEQRSQYAEYAKELGADYHLDLTTEVTHLLVGDTDTEKYRYVARDREDIKVLRPEWVEKVRDKWMNAMPLNVEALEAEYRLPTLFGLKICITGFDDLSFRAQLQKNVIENGGQYTGDLTKDVTHLVAAKPEGKKYEYGLQWQTRVVSLKWYKETLQRGMQLDESLYAPTMPIEEQGKGAWIRCKPPPQPSLGKRPRDEAVSAEPARKLRRTASTKLGSQSNSVWNDIIKERQETATDTGHQPLRESKSAPVLRVAEAISAENPSEVTQATAERSGRWFLTGLSLCVQGFDQKRSEVLRGIIVGAGGSLADSLHQLHEASIMKPSASPNILLVPYDKLMSEVPQSLGNTSSVAVVTELWLEQCMNKKTCINPTAYPLGLPLGAFPGEEFADLSINVTGFSGLETLHISKIVRLLGARYDQVFTDQVSVLVCNSTDINPQKVAHAREWKIPAVTEEWLWSCLTDRRKAPFEQYLLYYQANQKRKRHNPNETIHEQPRNAPNPPMDQLESSSHTTSAATVAHPHRKTASSTFSVYEDASNEMLLQGGPEPSEDRTSVAILQQREPGNEDTKNLPRVDNTRAEKAAAIRITDAVTTEDRSVQSAIQELLNATTKAKASVAAQDKQGQELPKKRFFGRALSNLSNSSTVSNVRYSRAGSVDSINTDGIGSEIGMAPPEKNSEPINLSRKTSFNFTGRARAKMDSGSEPEFRSANLNQQDDERSQEDNPPRLTQLVYEDPAEAIMLRKRLAQVIQQGSHTAQENSLPEVVASKENKVLRDDGLSLETSWGTGRRTRQGDRDRQKVEGY